MEYLRTLEMLKNYGWSWRRCIPHGGHQMSLNIAAGLGLGGNESYPDLFQPYGGFPDGVRVEDGHITMPELPGIGFEGKVGPDQARCAAWRHKGLPHSGRLTDPAGRGNAAAGVQRSSLILRDCISL